MDRLPQILRAIPRHCFQKDQRRTWGFLARDLILLFALLLLISTTDSFLLKMLLAVVTGCVLTGLFVLGHDAGHRSFSDNQNLNEIAGHLCCSLTLWPFHVWRLSHDHHHKWTHNAGKDLAWRPLSIAEFQELSLIKKVFYYLSRSFLFFWASMLFQYFMVDDAIKGKFFESQDRAIVKRSVKVTLAIAVAYIASSFYIGGFFGFVFMFLIPQLVFQFWLSFFTLLHHTAPDGQFMSEKSWDPAKAQLSHSINVRYPAIVDWLTHDIAWHVPHHVCVGIPHYNLRDAHAALQKQYPQYVREVPLSFRYVWTIISNCHLVDQLENDPVMWRKIRPIDFSSTRTEPVSKHI